MTERRLDHAAVERKLRELARRGDPAAIRYLAERVERAKHEPRRGR